MNFFVRVFVFPVISEDGGPPPRPRRRAKHNRVQRSAYRAKSSGKGEIDKEKHGRQPPSPISMNRCVPTHIIVPLGEGG